ncbi:MAG: hypothetical protein ACYC99_02850 [Candidatus Geothermincolia bacterium]
MPQRETLSPDLHRLLERPIGARHRTLQPVGLEREPLAAKQHPGIAHRQSRQAGQGRLAGLLRAGLQTHGGRAGQIEIDPRPRHRQVEGVEKGRPAMQQRRKGVAGADAIGVERGEGSGSRHPARAHPLENETGGDRAPDLRDRGVETERLAQDKDDQRFQQGAAEYRRQEQHEEDP